MSGEAIDRKLLVEFTGHDVVSMNLCKDRRSRDAHAECITVNDCCVLHRVGPEPIAVNEKMTVVRGLTNTRDAVVDRGVHGIKRGLQDVHLINVSRRAPSNGPRKGRGLDRFRQVYPLFWSQLFRIIDALGNAGGIQHHRGCNNGTGQRTTTGLINTDCSEPPARKHMFVFDC